MQSGELEKRRSPVEEGSSKKLVWIAIGVLGAGVGWLVYKQLSSDQKLKAQEIAVKRALTRKLQITHNVDALDVKSGTEMIPLKLTTTDNQWRSLSLDGTTATLLNRLLFTTKTSGFITAYIVAKSKNLYANYTIAVSYKKDADGNEMLLDTPSPLNFKLPAPSDGSAPTDTIFSAVEPITIKDDDGSVQVATDETMRPLWDARIVEITIDGTTYIDFQVRGFNGKWISPEHFTNDGYSVATYDANTNILSEDDHTVNWSCTVTRVITETPEEAV